MALTHEQVARLNEIFAPPDHSVFRKGKDDKVGWVHLTEAAINDRLSEVDPSFEFYIVNKETRNTVGMGTIIVYGRLVVCGVTRENAGMAVVESTRSGDRESNEPEKSAVTDAFKRCARLFGVGKYILNMDGAMSEEQIAPWLQTNYPEQFAALPPYKNFVMHGRGGNQSSQRQQPPQKPAPTPPASQPAKQQQNPVADDFDDIVDNHLASGDSTLRMIDAKWFANPKEVARVVAAIGVAPGSAAKKINKQMAEFESADAFIAAYKQVTS